VAKKKKTVKKVVKKAAKKLVKKVAKKVVKKAVKKKAAPAKKKPAAPKPVAVKKKNPVKKEKAIVNAPVRVPVIKEEVILPAETFLPDTISAVETDMNGTPGEVTPEAEEKQDVNNGTLM